MSRSAAVCVAASTPRCTTSFKRSSVFGNEMFACTSALLSRTPPSKNVTWLRICSVLPIEEVFADRRRALLLHRRRRLLQLRTRKPVLDLLLLLRVEDGLRGCERGGGECERREKEGPWNQGKVHNGLSQRRSTHAHRYRPIFQCQERLRLHTARRRLQGPVRAQRRGETRRAQTAAGEPEDFLRRSQRAGRKTIGRRFEDRVMVEVPGSGVGAGAAPAMMPPPATPTLPAASNTS